MSTLAFSDCRRPDNFDRAPGGGVAQHVRDLAHVDHEGALRDAEGLSGDYACENPVCEAHCCLSCRHKRSAKRSLFSASARCNVGLQSLPFKAQDIRK